VSPFAIPELDQPAHRSRRFWPTIRERGDRMLRIAAVIAIVFSGSTMFYTRYFNVPRPPTRTYAARAPLNEVPEQSTQFETDAGHSREIQLRGGSLLLLRPSSRLTLGYLPLRGAVAALDGEMAIEMTKQDLVLDVRTSSGRAGFGGPGSYAIRCEAGCTAMLVTVGAGEARIRPDSVKKGGLELFPGDKGMQPKNGLPEKVTPGDGWPALQPAKVP